MAKLLCFFGLHKYAEQELHCAEKPDKPTFNAAISQRCCRCEKAYITRREMKIG